MAWRAFGLLVAVASIWLSPLAARAEVHSYALVIGANRGGHGQADLRYARADATQVAALLIELGRMPRSNVTLLQEPSPTQIQAELARLRTQLEKHASAGEQAKLLFYYSGHARARALSLGGGELDLESLRQALVSLPSTLTVAILDACQSGAISSVKGAVPAADFSVSTISDLNNAGVAVMASSTAAELSQESPELGASYFTHHLLTALRGAADRDHDGSVSLDEAYAYAYHNTLSDTLRTRVGSQHATLETELRGHGRVTLTFTRDADAQLRLPETLEGRIVVQQRERGAVLAELAKGQGAQLTLALPHGHYEVLVRRGIALAPQACLIALVRGSVHTLDTRGCPTVDPPPALAAKGDRPRFERWFLELGAGYRFATDDAYITTLHDFRFRDGEGEDGSFTPVLRAGIGVHPNVALLARVERLAKRAFDRYLDDASPAGADVHFSYKTWTFALGVRGRLPLLAERLVPFLELDFGLATTGSSYERVATSNSGDGYSYDDSYEQRHFGWVARADLGVTAHLFWKIGVVLSGGYDFAAALANEIGELHNDGGFHIGLALRLRGLSRGN